VEHGWWRKTPRTSFLRPLAKPALGSLSARLGFVNEPSPEGSVVDKTVLLACAASENVLLQDLLFLKNHRAIIFGMIYTFVGLGNPGEEYVDTRHNAGRMMLLWLAKSEGAEWKTDKKLNAQLAKINIGSNIGKKIRGNVGSLRALLVLPDSYMNNSGKSVKPLIGSLKAAEKLMVIYDDLDLPFGSTKMSFNKSSGGHKGLESIIKALKTEKFARIRIGTSPTSPTGKLRKPQGEEKVMKHILGKFKPDEMLVLKKLSKKVNTALETFTTSGLGAAMTEFN
jgi:PTH1 family peptidyl-tRNA hydrolase